MKNLERKIAVFETTIMLKDLQIRNRDKNNMDANKRNYELSQEISSIQAKLNWEVTKRKAEKFDKEVSTIYPGAIIAIVET
jgi:ATP-dependent Lon protease